MRVLVLGREDRPAPGLVQALGAERAAAVRRLLLARACAWAKEAFGADSVALMESASLAGALVEGASLAGALVESASLAGALADGGSAADGSPGGEAVVALSPELPLWHPELAASLRGDLEAGCALSLAPIFDGGLYLLAVADGFTDRAALAALDLAGPAGMGDLLALARRGGWDVGLLRAERALRSERDVRALLADPLTDAELRALLG